MKNLNKRGGKGMLPACCLLLRGREGVTLPAAAENKQITLKKENFNKAEIVYYSPLITYRPRCIRIVLQQETVIVRERCRRAGFFTK